MSVFRMNESRGGFLVKGAWFTIFLVSISVIWGAEWSINSFSTGFHAEVMFQGEVSYDQDGHVVLNMEDASFAIPGLPNIPVTSRLFVTPIDAEAFVKFRIISAETLEGVSVPEVPQPVFESGEVDYSVPSAEVGNVFPDDVVWLERFGTARFADLWAIRVAAAQKVGNNLILIKKLQLTVNFDAPLSHIDTDSRIFYDMLSSIVVNAESLPKPQQPYEGVYLAIIYDDYYSEAQKWVKWRKQCGFYVYTAMYPSQTGSGKDNIKNFIKDAYDNWYPRPDLVIFIGDDSRIPDYGYSRYTSDHPYSTLVGTDFIPDVIVGRYVCANVFEARSMLAKQIYYERDVRVGDWMLKGLCVSTYLHAISPPFNTLWVAEIAMRHGFTHFDTLFQSSTMHIPSSRITDVINAGVGIIDYRGWAGSAGWYEPYYRVSNVLALNNTYKTPIVTSIVCGTGDYGGSGTYFCEAWFRVGSPRQPRGGVAFYGTTDHGTHTRYNNPINVGFYEALFEHRLHRFGQAFFMSKANLYNSLIDWTSSIRKYYNTYNMLGDPGLRVWVTIPDTLDVTRSDIGFGGGYIEVNVHDSIGPVSDAVVTLINLHDEFFHIERTNPLGKAILPVPSYEVIDTLVLTVTADQFLPYVDTFPLHDTLEKVVSLVDTVIINDSTIAPYFGNNNGIADLGEHFQIAVKVSFNRDVSGFATLQSLDDNLVLNSTLCEFDSSSRVHWLRFEASMKNSFMDKKFISCWLTLYPVDFHPIVHEIRVPVSNVKLSLYPVFFSDTLYGDGDGVLEPGETGEITPFVVNENEGVVDSLVLVALSPSGLVYLRNFTKILPRVGHTVPGYPDSPILVRLAESAPSGAGAPIEFYIKDGDDYRFLGKYFVPTPGTLATSPTGPDYYGYFAYEDGDSSSFAPVFDWFSHSDYTATFYPMYDDITVEVALPFPIKFYGETYDRITFSDNGWIYLGGNLPYWHIDFVNQPIPSAGGPFGMIAPFWDDLDGDRGEAYTFYDSLNHLFVVEWDSVYHTHFSMANSFEVVFYDPAHYPTPTGDAMLLFQYKDIHDQDNLEHYCTVGIEHPNKRIGLEYAFCHRYPATTKGLLDFGRAILFTTRSKWGRVTGTIRAAGRVPPDGLMLVTSRGNIVKLDQDGWFVFTPVDTGELTFTALCPGFFPQETTISVDSNANYELSFNLSLIPSPSIRVMRIGDSATINVTPPPSTVGGHRLTAIKIYRSAFAATMGKVIGELVGAPYTFVDDSIDARGSYYYRAVAFYEDSLASLPSNVDSAVFGSGVAERVPRKLEISIAPNPFNATTRILFSAPFTGRLDVYDITGRLTRSLRLNEALSVNLDMSDEPSGIYLVRIQSGSKTIIRRAVLIK